MQKELVKREAEVVIDLEEELAPEELESFKRKAKESGAASLTEHFKDVFLRVPSERQAG
jgi:hypothetical protein